MSQTIQVKLTEQRCDLGDAYAQKHMTHPPKTALLSCEGMCLRGEISRRAANLIAHKLVPEQTVRVCHGGLLEVSGGMRDLVERAGDVWMLDGCSLACGTRLLRGAMPDVRPVVIFTNQYFQLEEPVFGVDELPEDAIQAFARQVAEQVLARKLSTASVETVAPVSCGGGCG